MSKKTLIRVTTVPMSLEKLLENQLSFMSQHFNVIAVSSNMPELIRVATLQNVPYYCVELTRQITPLTDIKALFQLYRFFRKERPYIVHTHTPKAGTIGMIAARLAGVPNRLHTIAGLPLLEATGKRRKLLNLVERLTYSCATRIFPNSNGLKEIILQEGFCKASKLKVIGYGSSNGINTEYFSLEHFKDKIKSVRENLKIDTDDFVFIFVGRLVPDKGLYELVRAFCRINTRYPKTKLLLVGPEEASLYPLTAETKELLFSHDSIRSVGYQSDVRPYFAIANVLTFPSYREGFPNVVMQAGAMQLPSIVSDINGCNEIIDNGVNGLVVPAKDDLALEGAMEAILTNKDLYGILRSNARQMIVDRFEQTNVWDEILKEYRALEAKSKTL